jgi:rod shape-determining protein MreD
VILALLWLNEFLLFWIDGIAGHAITDWWRWIPVPVSAVLWPLVTGFYARFAPRR